MSRLSKQLFAIQPSRAAPIALCQTSDQADAESEQ